MAEATPVPSSSGASGPRSRMRDTNIEQRPEAPDIVRPGRLLTTLHAMRQELEVQLAKGGIDNPNSAETLALLRRLDEIRLEALVSLDRVQHTRAAMSTPDASGLDYETELELHDATVKQF